jgi:hypothetical protein
VAASPAPAPAPEAESLEAFLRRASGPAQPTTPVPAPVAAASIFEPLALLFRRATESAPPAPAPVTDPLPEPIAPAAESAPVAPPAPTPAPVPEPAPAQRPAVARILSKMASVSGIGRLNQDARAGDAWPHATPWNERPLSPRNWTFDAVDDIDEPELQVVAAAELPAPAEVAAVAEPVAAVAEVPAEAVAAAAVPAADMSVPAAEPEPAPLEPVPAAEMPSAAALPEPILHTIFEIPGVTDDVPSPHGQGPAWWPPLGARWPSRETPGAPWPVLAAEVSPMAALDAAAGQVTQMWAESSQEVLNRGTVRVCHHCALPVSTQARFCRRCGTRQA